MVVGVAVVAGDLFGWRQVFAAQLFDHIGEPRGNVLNVGRSAAVAVGLAGALSHSERTMMPSGVRRKLREAHARLVDRMAWRRSSACFQADRMDPGCLDQTMSVGFGRLVVAAWLAAIPAIGLSRLWRWARRFGFRRRFGIGLRGLDRQIDWLALGGMAEILVRLAGAAAAGGADDQARLQTGWRQTGHFLI